MRRRKIYINHSIPDGMSSINITPMLDLMFVLLVVFMVAIPIMLSSVKIDLPALNTDPIKLSEGVQYITVSIDAQNNIFINEIPTTEVEMANIILTVIGNNIGEKKFFIKADQSLQYGYVIHIMSVLYDLGYRSVSLLTSINSQKEHSATETIQD